MLERKWEEVEGYCAINDIVCFGYGKEGDCKGCINFVPKYFLEENKMQEKEIDVSTATVVDTTTFVNEINIPDENGAKNHCTDSPNFHRHHGKLSRKIQELCEEVGKLKEEKVLTRAALDLLMSIIPDDVFKRAVKNYFKKQDQKVRVKREVEKLREMEKNLVKITDISFKY